MTARDTRYGPRTEHGDLTSAEIRDLMDAAEQLGLEPSPTLDRLLRKALDDEAQAMRHSQVGLDRCPECGAPLEEDFAGTRVGVTVLADGTRGASDTAFAYERLFCTNGHAVRLETANELCAHGCGRDALVELDNGQAVCGPCSLGANPECPACGNEAA